MEKISIVVPCYNEEETIDIFYEEISKIIKKMKKVSFELVFVDDGSKDKTLDKLKLLAKKDKIVKFISFSRNFGKEAGIFAGFEYATGDYIATMDVDLQDPPYLLEEMYETIKQGEFDCIGTRSISRNGYSFLRKIYTKWFYKLISKMSKTTMVDGARDFRLMTRQMVNAILSMKEYNRYSKGIFAWVGFKTKWITFENQDRVAGTTKWNFFSLFGYAIDGIVGFSTKPLLISAFLGIILFLLAFIFVIVIIVKTICLGDPVGGWPSLACIILFIGGAQLFCLGIVGEYLAKTYLETKKRPIYIIKETENGKKIL